MDSLKQLQELLRDLFQLDLADLDFGLYRLLRIKQKEVESFLNDQLPRRVEESFHSVTGEQLSVLESEISKLSTRIQEEIGEDALLPNGEINPDYRDTKIKAARTLFSDYEKVRHQLQATRATEEQKSEVFNHLYAFFSRYYESGDFIPRRRYGVREAYAIPYNGEETFFHWVNKNQHYVKTGETFRDYAYQLDTMSGPCRVRFLLAEASLPPSNTKGDTRYFFPLPDQVAWDKESRTLKFSFHYRLPTEEEIEKWGKNSKLQETVLNTSLPKILEAVPEFTLRSALSEVVEEKDDQKISLLLKRMRHFCRRNTTDYFIHRDLEGFLKRELEFYLKDQVLHLADMEGDLEAKRRTIRVIRQLAEEVITFLAQIENVQKRLFEKKKFVLRTDYLVPIKEVSHDLWRDVLDNKAQLDAWRDLFAVDPKKDLFNQKGKINEQFIKDHPTLVVNTAHFSPAFKEKLLAAFDDLDEATDGLLIHSENYQALRFLERKYAGKVKCIYIDPPYNTGSDEFIYKDRYRHSTWLAMMEERLILTGEILSINGMIFVSIDDNEQVHLKKVMDSAFGEEQFLATAVWQKVYSPRMDAKGFSEDHDFIIIFGGGISRVSFKQNVEQFISTDSATGKPYRRRSLRKEGSSSRRQDRPNLFFKLSAPDNTPFIL
ncbi:MAG: site-specific DNA-methyltransferase [Thermodesulfobacteriota bacterium]|jgi:adenine-specific DNA-methyltransferase